MTYERQRKAQISKHLTSSKFSKSQRSSIPCFKYKSWRMRPYHEHQFLVLNIFFTNVAFLSKKSHGLAENPSLLSTILPPDMTLSSASSWKIISIDKTFPFIYKLLSHIYSFFEVCNIFLSWPQSTSGLFIKSFQGHVKAFNRPITYIISKTVK